MAGNVSEWTADHYEEFGGSCWDGSVRQNPLCYQGGSGPWVAKGGSFVGTYHQLQGVWRYGTERLSGARGVRCARDLIAE
jgi:formylglycine-generating enzyme required for sulfatase activity